MDALYSRLHREYPSAGEKLEHQAENFAVTFRVVNESGVRSKRTGYVDGIQWQQNRMAVLFEYDEPGDDNVVGKVFCATPQYRFDLTKYGADSPYVVRYYGDNPKRVLSGYVIASSDLGAYVFAAFQVWDLPVRDLLADPHLKILSITKITTHDEELIEIQFDLAESSLWYSSGRVTLSPTWGWAVRNYEAVLKGKVNWVKSGRISYRRWPSKDGEFIFPWKVELIERITRPGQGIERRVEEGEFLEVRPGVVTGNEFALPFYGVPDIPLHPENGHYPFDNWLFWLLLVTGILCAAVLWCLRRWKRIIETTSVNPSAGP